MKKSLLALIMGASMILAACGGAENEASDDSATASGDPEKLYGQKCSMCHGQELEGMSGPKLAEIGAKYSQEEIEKIILNGKGAMPGGLLEGEQATTMAEWLAEKK